VGLLVEIKVYDADGEEHAARIAKAMIGKALRSIPLRLVEVADLDPADQRPVRSG